MADTLRRAISATFPQHIKNPRVISRSAVQGELAAGLSQKKVKETANAMGFEFGKNPKLNLIHVQYPGHPTSIIFEGRFLGRVKPKLTISYDHPGTDAPLFRAVMARIKGRGEPEAEMREVAALREESIPAVERQKVIEFLGALFGGRN